MLYLDTSATSPVHPDVLRAMWPFLSEEFGNPSSVHSSGQRARAAVDWARGILAQSMNARPGDILFTSGGTESANLAIKGLALGQLSAGQPSAGQLRQGQPGRTHLVTTPIEHPAVLESIRYLERWHGFTTTCLAVDSAGLIDLADARRAITANTALVSVGLANNEVGSIQPIREIARIAHDRGALIHTDAVQAFGAIPVSVAELEVDALSLSAHKLGGPKGVGALYVRRSLPLEPLLHGGGQEGGARSGTENVAGIVGLAAAAQLRMRDLEAARSALVAVRDRFIAAVERSIPHAILTGSRTDRLPGHVSWCFPGVSGESILVELDSRAIECSSGSACAAGQSEPSPVLIALGYDAETAQSALRLTFGQSTTEHDLSRVADALAEIVR